MRSASEHRSTTSPAAIVPESIVSAAPDLVACALGDAAALLDMRSSSYFSLNPVAAFVWERLAEPASVATLVGAVREGFAADGADVEADVIAMLATLRDADLVAVRPARGA